MVFGAKRALQAKGSDSTLHSTLDLNLDSTLDSDSDSNLSPPVSQVSQVSPCSLCELSAFVVASVSSSRRRCRPARIVGAARAHVFHDLFMKFVAAQLV